MIDFPYITELCSSTPSKIVMLVVDGLGGLAHPDTGKSELETAKTPNLDRLAAQSACGLTTPVAPGITSRQWAGASRPFRLRSRSSTSLDGAYLKLSGSELSSRQGPGCGEREFLHARRVRSFGRPPCRENPHVRER